MMTREERIASCTVDAVEVWGGEHPGIRLHWSGAPGFGTYTLLFAMDYDYDKDDVYELKVTGESECMDDNEDKGYLKHLLLSLADKVEIVE
jgi:hypothetical protein